MNDDFELDLMSEKETEESLDRLKRDTEKGLCPFCAVWIKDGHQEWCKEKWRTLQNNPWRET